jgi:hypothetical protein
VKNIITGFADLSSLEYVEYGAGLMLYGTSLEQQFRFERAADVAL